MLSALLWLLPVDATFLDADLELTPFGYFPKDCIRRVPEGSYVRQRTDGAVEVVRGDEVEVQHPKPHCVEHANKTLGARSVVRDGWLDYVEHYTPTDTYLGFFEGTYTIPDSPPAGMDGQTLFYFIGTENLGAEKGRDFLSTTILQPVLTWGNGHRDWNMASWNCCPAGEPTTSDFLTGLEAGTTAYGNITVDYDSDSATVVSSYSGKDVTLTITGELRTFNWMDVTLEVYTVDSCADFAASDATIDKMSSKDQDGKALVPVWKDATGSTSCSGSQTYTTTSWTDHHSTSFLATE
ncbi:hypothetical protein CTAYLR_005661 [Chrysophaeum taylorii]|uniref:Uncharacterized protein n=1 Tax=Chrysophaeum taylorii TaxID=2483200 RepID=A0AAD7XP11_9STRA|nr:hypothetical protein CTAYLR_005661 [Chrysophaeum taylorii]